MSGVFRDVCVCFLGVFLSSCSQQEGLESSADVVIESEEIEGSISENTTKIAFGSCGHQGHDLPIFYHVVEHQPDFFVFLGDNIYGDTQDMEVLAAKYQQLGEKDSFQQLKENVTLLATWDDHDYGWNDAGKSYPLKEESKQIFLDFFEEPLDSVRRNRQGIYHAQSYTYQDRVLQIILLDCRTFRDEQLLYNSEFSGDRRYFYRLDYRPNEDPNVSILGEEQWQWLEEQLQQPADLRIIATSSQFGIEFNGYEAWANYPLEQQKMLSLIQSTQANGVMFISGDIHYSEISKLETDFYPIYDFTSSGLSSTWLFATPNRNRIEGPIMENHFGLITVDWAPEDPVIQMETWDIRNNQRIEYTISLSELQH